MAAVLVLALLVSCGTSRKLDGAVTSDPACTRCHGDPERPGDPADQAAPPGSVRGADGGAHLAHLQARVACGACHVVPASPAHADGAVDVAFSGLALARGARPAFSGGRDGRCAGVYCHGATLGPGGRVREPSWSGGPLGCDACHGVPPPGHDAANLACAGCHPGTVRADGSIDRANGFHVNGAVEATGAHRAGWKEATEHGYVAKTSLASCRSCHGVALDGAGGSASSCAPCHEAAGYPAWQSNCTFCHGAKVGTYSAASLPRTAPPKGSQGQTLPSTRAVGAHQAHGVGGALGPAVGCAECHEVPADLKHLDGTATVTFGALAVRGGVSPRWNGSTCASTYCHGATLRGGSVTAPSWTGGGSQAACGACHGVPPPAPHSSSTACGTCHTGYTSASVDRALHLDGKIDASGGHPAGWEAKAQHGYSVNRSGMSACKACHGADLGGGTSGISCTGCHANAGFSAWATTCTFCHGNRSTGVASPPLDTQGRSAAGNVSVGVHASHLGTAWMATPACSACHPDRTGSNAITDAAHVDGDGVAEVSFGALARIGGAAATYRRASATSASCTAVYCHGAFPGGAAATVQWTTTAQVGCTSCHGSPPRTGEHGEHGSSCGNCHPGYTSSSVNRATHVDGKKDVGNRITSWNASTQTCRGCHGNDRWTGGND